MNILLVAATSFEIAPLLKEMNAHLEGQLISSYTYKQHKIDVLITGIGIAHTSFYLGKYLTDKYNLVINAGICGSFTDTLSIGEVVRIEEDCFADLGAEDDEQFLSIEELNLSGTYYIKNENVFNHTYLHRLQNVKGATVNTTHGNTVSINKFLTRTKVGVESMEGAAFLFACNQSKTTCVQLRAVSNYIEKRDRSKWNIPLAIENLNAFLIDFIKLF
ncbi:MAG TPA: futalosine hydrolase [Bacteroidia bacterium]